MSEHTLWDAAQPVNSGIQCSLCGETKPASEFYPKSKACKPCICRRVRENRSAKREKYSAYERDRYHRPDRRVQMRDALRRRRARHPEKSRARDRVQKALKSGRLVRQPCEVCGSTVKVQAHHDDYSKPLDVRWLCFKHHREDAHGQVVVSPTGGSL